MSIDRPEPPPELKVSIEEFFPEAEWENAADIAWLESGFNAFALNDTATRHGCGTVIGKASDGTVITAERSVSYFQINSCNFPTWDWHAFYNARHNTGTAHMLWEQAGQNWGPWYFSARKLGLI